MGNLLNLKVNLGRKKGGTYFGLNSSTTNFFGVKNRNSKDILDLNWKKAKKKYPKLKPTGDFDFDGTMNFKDCKPLDPSRDGKMGDMISKLRERIKSYRERPKEIEHARDPPKQKVKVQLPSREQFQRVRRELTKRRPYGVRVAGITVRNPKTQRKGGSRGRPAGSYKYSDPFTGQKVPVHVYKSRMNIIRKRNVDRASRAQTYQRVKMARRGVPPSLARQIQMAKQREMYQRYAQTQMVAQPPAQTPLPPNPYTQSMIEEKIKRLPPGYYVTPEGRVMGPAPPTSPYQKVRSIFNKTSAFFNRRNDVNTNEVRGGSE